VPQSEGEEARGAAEERATWMLETGGPLLPEGCGAALPPAYLTGVPLPPLRPPRRRLKATAAAVVGSTPWPARIAVRAGTPRRAWPGTVEKLHHRR